MDKPNKGDWGASKGTRGTPGMLYISELMENNIELTPAHWAECKRLNDEYWRDVIVPEMRGEKEIE
jgi:hypothetical protein